MSIPSRSTNVKDSPSNCFHTVGAKFKGTGDFDMIPKPMMQPKKRNISRWVGLVASGFSKKHSRRVPHSVLLFGDLINRGNTPVSSSLLMLTSESLKGPPASIEPSPRNLVSQHFLSVLFCRKFLKSG